MSRAFLSKVALSLILALSPVCGASDTAHARAVAACESHLAELNQTFSKQIRITPADVLMLSRDDLRDFTALLRVLIALDESTLDLLARALIVAPDASEVEAIRDLAFFDRHPGLANAYAAENYHVLKSDFADRFEPFEMALLASLIPHYAKASERGFTEHRGLTPAKQKYVEVVNHPTLGPAALRLFDLMLELGSITVLRETPLDSVIGMRLDDEAVARTRGHMVNGRINATDARIINAMIGIMNNKVMEWAAQFETPVKTPVVMRTHFWEQRVTRDYSVTYHEKYFAEELGEIEGLADLVLVKNSMGHYDPLPVPGHQLRAGIVANAEKILFPIRQRLKALAPTAPSPAPAIAPAKPVPYQLKMSDHFVRKNDGIRIREPKKTRTEVTEPSAPWAPPLIDADHALRNFTSFGRDPFSMDELSDQRIYEFWYLGEKRPVTRRIRFGAEVVNWLRAEPRVARSILNAIHLGRSNGKTPGIKPWYGYSRHFDGPVYEVKIRDSARAILLMVDGIWQVVRISNKRDIANDVQWVRPLD